MGLIPSIIKRNWSQTNDKWFEALSPKTKTGIKVTEKNSLKYLTLLACVSLVSGDIAKLPFSIYKKDKNGGKKRQIGSRLDDVIHNAPNEHVNAFSWREAVQCQLMLWGNSYSEIIKTPYSGEVIALELIDDPGAVDVFKTRKGIFYRWTDEEGRKIVKQKSDILHIPGFGFTGLIGLSMIGLAREAIALGLSEEEFGATFFSKGTHPSGFLSMPPGAGGMSVEKRDEYDAYLKKSYAGLGKAHGIMLLPNGETYSPLTIPPNDAQFLESRAFQKDEICGIYHVPPHKIAKHGANSNYNNLEQENQNYVDSCLSHWVARWESCITNQLIPEGARREGVYAAFKLQGLLRGDTKARGEFYKTLWAMGLPLNEILSKEDENPVKDGNISFVPANMIPASASKLVTKQETKKSEETEESNFHLPGEIIVRDFRPKLEQNRENRSIIYRDRLSSQFLPLIKRSMGRIVDHEITSISSLTENRDLKSLIKEFYRSYPDFIIDEISPVFTAFGEAIRTAALEEMGVDLEIEDIETFVYDYIRTFASRHAGSGENQLKKISDTEINQRLDEWKSHRAIDASENESVRFGNAVFQQTVFAAGMATTWQIRGAHTCAFCKLLNGKKVRKGGFFVGKGEVMSPEGENPITNRGIKRHPPLHKGCDCYLGISSSWK